MHEVNFEREVLDRLMRLETKIDLQDYKGLSEKVEQQHDCLLKDEQAIENLDERLSKLEDNNKWLWRTLVGAVITGIVGLIFVFLKIGLGVN